MARGYSFRKSQMEPTTESIHKYVQDIPAIASTLNYKDPQKIQALLRGLPYQIRNNIIDHNRIRHNLCL